MGHRARHTRYPLEIEVMKTILATMVGLLALLPLTPGEGACKAVGTSLITHRRAQAIAQAFSGYGADHRAGRPQTVGNADAASGRALGEAGISGRLAEPSIPLMCTSALLSKDDTPKQKDPKVPKSEEPGLEGVWKYELQVIGGDEIPEKNRSEIWVEICGNMFNRCADGDLPRSSKIILYRSRTPKAFDLEFTHPLTGKVSVSKGIYELKGDVLKLCYDNTGKERPKTFQSTEETANVVLSVLKRVKKR